MEQEKLPNASSAMTIAIFAFIGCCCTNGILGIPLGLIALSKTKKDTILYNENPSKYLNFEQVKTAKIIAIVGLALSILNVIYLIVIIATGQLGEQMEQVQEMIDQMQNPE